MNAYGQGSTVGAPAPHYIGLGTATTWVTSHAYAVGNYVIPTTFNSISGQTGKIFKVTTAGTSTSQPTWPTTSGGTVTGGGGEVYTEVSQLFAAGTFTGFEVSGGAYARVSVTANSTNFPNATSAVPDVLTNGTAISFATPTADWGLIVAVLDWSASSAGNCWFWAPTGAAVDASIGSSPSIAASSLTLSIT